MVAIEIGPNFGFVILTLFGAIFLANFWMSFKVVAARKKYKVKYPALYADKGHPDAEAFNCVQRAHQNTLEMLPAFLVSLFVAGLKFPITASIGGLIVIIGRVLYFLGYSTGNPEARHRGDIYVVGLLTLYISIITWGVQLIAAR